MFYKFNILLNKKGNNKMRPITAMTFSPGWNSWNGSVSLLSEIGMVVGFLGEGWKSSATRYGTRMVLAASTGEFGGNLYRNNADHSGRSIIYSVNSDGTLSKL